MARMLRAQFKMVGRCHAWCGNREFEICRTAEKREWVREATDDAWPDLYSEYDALERIADWRGETFDDW